MGRSVSGELRILLELAAPKRDFSDSADPGDISWYADYIQPLQAHMAIVWLSFKPNTNAWDARFREVF
jgi:hypothetical protein